ncbi:MAG TPA: WecB/TagA/CpsF family glycosyltransferase [Clostridia bacterium]|nr:WecB/TagA/CpsF family glycosyltransferase [Clostridia bacterium]
MPKIKVLNIEFDNLTLDEAAGRVMEFAQGDTPRIVVTPNAEIAECCYQNEQLSRAVAAADMAVPDGISVVMASKILGRPLKTRLPGIDLARMLFPMMIRKNLSLYLLGAKPDVAAKAAKNLQTEFPGLRIAGIQHGYFKNDDAVIEAVNRSGADVLFVAMGFPRQEIWMAENRDQLRVGVMLGLGGSLDVFAGEVRRAPDFFIRLNLEWLYRLIKQPSRFGRMLKLPRYLLRAIGVRIFGGEQRK